MAKLQIEYKPIEKVIPYDKNPRQNDDAVQYVAESIKEFGFINPILLDASGTVMAGHTRLKAAKQLGMTEVPVVYVDDLSEEQARAFRLADNKTAEFASWDEGLLEQELAEILELDMSLFGFDDESTLADELIDDKYTLAVNIPQYEITGDCPTFDDMLDTDKSKELIAEIEASGVSEDEKKFLYGVCGHSVADTIPERRHDRCVQGGRHISENLLRSYEYAVSRKGWDDVYEA